MKNTTLIIRVAVVMLILSWSLQASAQADPNYEDRLFYTSKYYKYKKMKTTGLIMTLGGGILGIVGLSKIANAPTTINNQGQVVATGADANRGAIMFLISIPLVGAGVPLSIVGTVKSKKYERLMESTTIGSNVSPHHVGVKLTYRF